MSTMTINSVSSKTIDLSEVIEWQGFQANPSVRLNRRGRLARTLVVLSLAIVAASVAGGQAGADTSKKSSVAASTSYVTVTVAGGETLWSLASALADGREVRGLVADIVEINSLPSVDVATGQQIRIPLS